MQRRPYKKFQLKNDIINNTTKLFNKIGVVVILSDLLFPVDICEVFPQQTFFCSMLFQQHTFFCSINFLVACFFQEHTFFCSIRFLQHAFFSSIRFSVACFFSRIRFSVAYVYQIEKQRFVFQMQRFTGHQWES